MSDSSMNLSCFLLKIASTPKMWTLQLQPEDTLPSLTINFAFFDYCWGKCDISKPVFFFNPHLRIYLLILEGGAGRERETLM